MNLPSVSRVNAAYAAGIALQAAELYISVCTAGSHLGRIRDETGCRRHADLTCLA
jgi:DNA-binding CsgD family transcriptional regulator